MQSVHRHKHLSSATCYIQVRLVTDLELGLDAAVLVGLRATVHVLQRLGTHVVDGANLLVTRGARHVTDRLRDAEIN